MSRTARTGSRPHHHGARRPLLGAGLALVSGILLVVAALGVFAGAGKASPGDLTVTVQPTNKIKEWIGHASHQHIVTWINHSKVDRTILFIPGRWPFSEPEAPITLAAGATEKRTVAASATPDKYQYAFLPAVMPAKPGPPDGPAVVVDP